MPSFNDRFVILQKHVFGILTRLPSHLTYHHAGHTHDVLAQSMVIAKAEGIRDDWDLWLLQTAALLHDTGFTQTYQHHEERSCELASEILPKYGYTPAEISYIQTLIMATKIPQSPTDKLGCILCDADLDYLGRDDFWPISEGLRKEWMHVGIIKTDKEWMQKQLAFFRSHQYFTAYCRESREPQKQLHLEMLENKRFD